MSSYQNPTYPSMDNVPPTYQQQVPPYPQGTPYQQQQQPTTFPAGTPYPTGVPYTYPQTPTQPTYSTAMPIQSSYIENILRLNLGKVVTVYMNFENSQWGSKIFKGVLRAAGLDHIIIVDEDTGIHYLLLTIYLDYITFSEPISYEYPFIGATGPSAGTAPPQTAPYTQTRKKEKNE